MKKIVFFNPIYIVSALVLVAATACSSARHTAKTNRQTNDATAYIADFLGAGMEPMDGMPPGPPPDGGQTGGKMPPKGQKPPMGMPPGGGPGGERFNPNTIAALLTLNANEISKTDTVFHATAPNQSVLVAFGQSKATLTHCVLNTSGQSSSPESSSFQGLNAAILGRDESRIVTEGNTINTSGSGANAIFAYGKSIIHTKGDVIDCTGGGGHGIMCSGGGTILASDIQIVTAGANSGAIATDRGSGTITVQKGKIVTKGLDSPAIYSTGKISVSHATLESTASEIAVIEGSNAIRLDSCTLLNTVARKWGVMIYQSFSGDAEGADGEFEMNHSQLNLSDKDSPLFFVTNSTAYIRLCDNRISCASGILLQAKASRWGHQGSNGGTAVISTSKQRLDGTMLADKNSRIRLQLTRQSLFTGSINPDRAAKSVTVDIDAGSSWTLTEDAYVHQLKAVIEQGQVLNVIGNGHVLYYDPTQNAELKAKTYPLKNGGSLQPFSSTSVQ